MNTYVNPGADWPDKLKSMNALEFSDRARKVLACMNAEDAVDFSDAEIERTLSRTVAPVYCIAVAKEARDRGLSLPLELTDESIRTASTVTIFAGRDCVGDGFVSVHRDGKHSSSTSGIRNLMRIDNVVDDYIRMYTGFDRVEPQVIYIALPLPIIGAF